MSEVRQDQWIATVADLQHQLHETKLQLLREMEEREFYRVRYHESQAMNVKQQALLSSMNEHALRLIRAVHCVNQRTEELLHAADSERARAMGPNQTEPLIVTITAGSES